MLFLPFLFFLSSSVERFLICARTPAACRIRSRYRKVTRAVIFSGLSTRARSQHVGDRWRESSRNLHSSRRVSRATEIKETTIGNRIGIIVQDKVVEVRD